MSQTGNQKLNFKKLLSVKRVCPIYQNQKISIPPEDVIMKTSKYHNDIKQLQCPHDLEQVPPSIVSKLSSSSAFTNDPTPLTLPPAHTTTASRMYEPVPNDGGDGCGSVSGGPTIITPSRRNKLTMCGEENDEEVYTSTYYSTSSPNRRLPGASTATLVRDQTRHRENNAPIEGMGTADDQLVTNAKNNNYGDWFNTNINERRSPDINLNLAKTVMDNQTQLDAQPTEEFREMKESNGDVHWRTNSLRGYRNGVVQRNGDNCFVGIGGGERVDVEHIKLDSFKLQLKATQHVGVQTTHLSPYRLRFWPVAASIKCLDASFMDVVKCCLRTLSQWFLSQVGLTCVLIVWALLGATAFYKTEGPREHEQAEQITHHKTNIAIDLATELRQLKEGSDKWPETIQKYLNKHESLLLKAVSSGYVEGGGSIWTYPGCVLFAVLLLTTLGFGAPVPRTSLGRGMAVLFSAIGIPLHFMLILNISSLIAKCLQNLATIKPTGELQEAKTKRRLWYKWFPPIVAVLYYVLGVICFGVLRKRSVVECLMFALDFTESGGVANTSGHVRILYALYIEIAVILAATIMSIVQVSATHGIIDLGLRLGLLTNT